MEAAHRSEHLRTTLLDAIAHEFKTPLTSIKAATTALLAHPDQSREATTELLSIADEEAERLRILIDDALELARLDREHIHLFRAPAVVADIVHEAAESVRIDPGRLSVASGAMPPVSVDRRLMRLAMRQILDNALKYSPPGTPIEVRVAHADRTVTIDFVDHGAGIPVQEQERIFERFYRGRSTGQVPGSGLGLSIANSIVRAHGGTLTVDSRKGETRLRIALPLDANGDPA
jgi:two-component system sensor histidine kinase KdpD